MNPLKHRERGQIQQSTTKVLLLSWLMCVVVGCGGDASMQQSSMPTADFAEKLEKEHPELFQKKVGKKVEILGGRDKRAVIRREWEKQQNPGG